jgi:type IV pilus assembly protein PilP
MIKRRSKTSFFPRGGLLFILLLTAAMPGCKKETPPPPPQATPLPKKPGPPAAVPVAPAAAVKPLQTAPSSARKKPINAPVQNQISSAKRTALPGAVNLDFSNRRDPFKPFVQAPAPQQPAAGRSSKGRGHDPLPIQSFDTEKFRISGIVTGLKENTALVIDPNGKGYVVKQGMQIGNNDGYIKRITNSTVEVEESFRDDNNKVRKRVVKLTLLRKK